MPPPPPPSTATASHALAHAAAALDTLRRDPAAIDRIDRVGTLIADRLVPPGPAAAAAPSLHKVLICGNGGSMCDAMHFAEELTGRFRPPPPAPAAERPPLAAIACSDPGHITCTANDFGFEHIFSRWVRALGRRGDILIVLSTSGNSPNILRAVEAARELGLTTIALLGKDGGALNRLCDEQWICPGDTADRIQELHMLILHTVIECIESRLRQIR